MPFKPGREPVPPDFKKLTATLNASDIKTKDNFLYTVVKALLDKGQQVNDVVSNLQKDVDSVSSSSGATGEIISDATFITSDSEVGQLPNSRQLIAGTSITIDLSVPNQITISSTGGAEWSVLTDGDLIEPELIFAGGDVIMTHIP